MRFAFSFLLVLFVVSLSLGHTTYTGYSGAPGAHSGQRCASSCHGSSTGTMTVTGFPTTYTPGTVYSILVRHSSGTSIRQFNGSVRVGTGSTNAGTIAASTNAATYNVTGETNGVKLSAQNLDSCRFNWTAPAAGTGSVRLYVAGMQGTSASGQNTTISLTSNEQTLPPPPAVTNPNPANAATGVYPIAQTLTWSRSAGAASYDVFFGTTNPPPSVGNRTDTTYTTVVLLPGTTYYWRVDARNSGGATTGTVWSFTTLATGTPSSPVPANQATLNEQIVNFQWTLNSTNTPIDLQIHIGQQNPPATHSILTPATRTFQDTLLTGDGVYYWRIDQVFSWGIVQGPLWQLTMATPQPPTNPSPTLADTLTTTSVTTSWTLPNTAGRSGIVYKFGVDNPPTQTTNLGANATSNNVTLTTITDTYYWEVDQVFPFGTVSGPIWHFHYREASSAVNENNLLPRKHMLTNVYPNPFNPSTTIRYSLNHGGMVTIKVYDVAGHEMSTLVNERQGAGNFEVTWNGQNAVSGTYFYRLTVDNQVVTGELTLIK